MNDAASRREPLHVATSVAGRRAERVGMIDEPPSHDGHRLEAAVRMLGKSGDHVAVVHAKAVFQREVHADVATGERHRRAELRVAFGVAIFVVHAKEERVERLPQNSSGSTPNTESIFDPSTPVSFAEVRQPAAAIAHGADASPKAEPSAERRFMTGT